MAPPQGEVGGGRICPKCPILDPPLVSILTGKKKTAFSCVHSSIAPSQSTLFLRYSCPPDRVRHTANLIRSNHLRDMGVQSFVLISSSFSSYAVRGLRGLRFFSHTMQKLL